MNLNQDLTIYNGDTAEYRLPVVDESGNIVNLTDFTIFFTVRHLVSDENIIIQKIVTDHTDPENGITEIIFSPAETKLIEKGRYEYDIKAKTPTGEVHTLKRGKFKVMESVTKDTD